MATFFSRAKYGLSRLNITAFVNKIRNILDILTGSTIYNEPIPALTVIEGHLEDLYPYVVEPDKLSTEISLLRKQKRQLLQEDIRLLARYIDQVAKGDPALIMQAGFEPTMPPQPVGPMPKPAHIKLVNQAAGRVKASTNVVRGVKSYDFQYREQGVETWTIVRSAKSWIIVDGLKSKTTYEFKAAYIGSDPTITYSDVYTANTI